MKTPPGTALTGKLDRWSPELRRAVMVARPEFFTAPADEQLHYRVSLPHGDREAIVAALLREQGKRQPMALAKLESRARVPLGLQNRVNEWLQPLVGIGEDAFSLNEHFAEGCGILDFETLLDYDRDDHAFQQDAKQRDIPGYQPQPYSGALHGTLARMLLEGRLCYVTLSMASWQLCGAMEDAAHAEIDALIPHRHVRGPEDGQRDESGTIRWDTRVDANGQEALLEELQRRVWDEQFRRQRELGLLFSEQRWGACFLDDHPWEEEDAAERKLLVVFGDPGALAAVRFEWLDSPVVYRADEAFLGAMRDAAQRTHRPEHSFHHHVRMARKNYREYLRGETVWLKKYLYVLRPLLATLWIEQGRGVAPMRFAALVEAIVTDADLREAIEQLLVAKRAAG